MSSAQASTKPAHAYRVQRTLDRLQDFAKDVEKSVNTILPTGATRYGKVAVLGYTWSNDDMKCAQAEGELFKVLRKYYNFITESYIIDATSQTINANLQRAFIKFREKHQGSDTLLIFIYSGHSRRDHNDNLQLFGTTATPHPPEAEWGCASAIVKTTSGRKLLIFDSCYAATAGTQDSAGPELISASAINNQAAAHATYNFTTTLKNALESLQGKPKSVGQIYSEICRNAMRSQLEVTPVHILEKNLDSVVLERCPAASTSYGTANEKQRRASLQELGDSRFKALIQVHLRGEVPSTDVAMWKEWLCSNLPTMIGKITLEAAYTGNPTIWHVSMPIEVWDGLPADQSAYNFVSWIKGNNILPSVRSPPGLPIRERGENTPFAESSRHVNK
ncbi:hmg-i hmg-dna-binding protein [Diplodia corticola]|uniref:Hmg-i hmg-dna-binding protein n=1 Tax=Diplodia corticola TaxID=236234 RepID=A0A1J9RER1_9PEZI|nr:hmg-i hmg-dna-binding protein [Diplodia corticola]OJD38889.1 hmg-i hmg-dna-binding protein [Diplodia corticola]